jgi:hypothetical protein
MFQAVAFISKASFPSTDLECMYCSTHARICEWMLRSVTNVQYCTIEIPYLNIVPVFLSVVNNCTIASRPRYML